jgi:hypothetical protein
VPTEAAVGIEEAAEKEEAVEKEEAEAKAEAKAEAAVGDIDPRPLRDKTQRTKLEKFRNITKNL